MGYSDGDWWRPRANGVLTLVLATPMRKPRRGASIALASLLSIRPAESRRIAACPLSSALQAFIHHHLVAETGWTRACVDLANKTPSPHRRRRGNPLYSIEFLLRPHRASIDMSSYSPPRGRGSAAAPSPSDVPSSSGSKRKRNGENKFYAVRAGHKTGVFLTWADCYEQIKGFKGAICMYCLLPRGDPVFSPRVHPLLLLLPSDPSLSPFLFGSVD